jgi:hypothetical protein
MVDERRDLVRSSITLATWSVSAVVIFRHDPRSVRKIDLHRSARDYRQDRRVVVP